MKLLITASLLLLISTGVSAQADSLGSKNESDGMLSKLQHQKWIHGSADCELNTDPAIEVFRYDQSSYILRQNKCLNFEAPFIYVLMGTDTAIALDTGASESSAVFPIFEIVQTLIGERKLIVVHSHSHNDHHAGDAQFVNKPNTTVIEPSLAAVTDYFKFTQWPEGEASINLGDRLLTVFPTPGHQSEGLAIYDPQTQWLLTGDTLYPGYIYVREWAQYKRSISRLENFTTKHKVSAILGAHIEMKKTAGEYYSIGTSYQPDEASLVLTPQDLNVLNQALQKSDEETEVSGDRFIVAPLNFIQKAISTIIGWITD